MSRSRTEERTGFQESGPYHADYDLQTDFVMVYGIDATMEERIGQWREKGYVVHLMTGIAWGTYNDYLDGKTDGREHWDEAQTDRNGKMIVHGTKPVVIPYMVPTLSFTDFLAERIRIAVDAGVEAIHLEEPEFWVNGGYSEAFKREWQLYYGEPWSPPHVSPDAQYRASKLKAFLYTRALDRLCAEMKDYALLRYGRQLRFYVPTHSLINYTQWRIVSPESRLLELPSIDGYIAQIWTGTSRTPNVYEGVRKERTFETSYLEYGIMQELVRGTDRRMWFLHDPIEDNPNHTWSDYKQNYIKTVVASLLHPGVAHFEVSPWPRRIFRGKYPSEDGKGKEPIPADYATTLLHVMHTLGNMDQNEIETEDEVQGIGVLIADSAMFQRMKPNSADANEGKYDGTDPIGFEKEGNREMLDFSPFYGLALPLLKHGIPVRPVQLDNVRRFAHYLQDYRVLLLSYEYMKPEYPDLHYALSGWVREGGALIYVGDDSDPYHRIRAWWNESKGTSARGRTYVSPREHLFEQLELGEVGGGVYKVGKGAVGYLAVRPDECAVSKAGAESLRATVRQAMEMLGDPACVWRAKHYFKLRRGPYVIAAAMEESVADEPLEIEGPVVDLFDPALPVKRNVRLAPGKQSLLFDVEAGRPKSGEAAVISASSRIEELTHLAAGFSFIARGPASMRATARFYCPLKPISATLECEGKTEPAPWEWDEGTRSVLLHYRHGDENKAKISVAWKS
ncbi:hypothetical protein [Cohnella cellulosilytica]|uniref:Beta-galactosidase trimerisation domain-containing protein n=1 Tax=Cohnella cellulosilytica TaxID=986710 RepID=A0ABW2FF83_9BACL